MILGVRQASLTKGNRNGLTIRCPPLVSLDSVNNRIRRLNLTNSGFFLMHNSLRNRLTFGVTKVSSSRGRINPYRLKHGVIRRFCQSAGGQNRMTYRHFLKPAGSWEPYRVGEM